MTKKQAITHSIYSLLKQFPDESSAVAFIEKRYWGARPVCPYCSGIATLPRLHRHGHWCKKCRKDFTVRIGTLFEHSRLPLHKWLLAMYLVVTARKGISSLQLSKELGITQKTAWFLLHRIRAGCKVEQAHLLRGIVEVDETYIGGLEANKHRSKRTEGTQGRNTRTKVAVLGLRQRGGDVRAKAMDLLRSDGIQRYLDENVASGAVLSTDDARFYRPIRNYSKLSVKHSVGEFVNGMASTNGIESVWAVLKRGYHGTFHHFSKKHLGRYVDEFSFRLNEGNCKIDTMDRIHSLIAHMRGRRLTYETLIRDV